MSALADFGDAPLWVAWRNEHDPTHPEKPPQKKTPYNPHTGKMAKSNDPKTWGTRAAAEARARRIVNGAGGGIGINLADLGDGTALAGIDLDTCRDPEGGFTDWADEVIRRFDSYAEVSPSGTGAKVFFRLRAEDRAAVLAEIRAPGEEREGAKWSLGDGKNHPPAIELYLGRRYFAVTEQLAPGMPSALRLVDPDAVRWLVREAGPALVKRGRAKGHDQTRSAKAFRKGIALRRGGATFEEMKAALLADPETVDWTREKGLRDGGRELRNIWDHPLSAQKPDLTIDPGDLTEAARDIGKLLAATGRIFVRDVPMKVVAGAESDLPTAAPMTPNNVVIEAHRLCRPVVWNERKGKLVETTLPDRVARLYLDMREEWGLAPLDGITTAPLLAAGGAISFAAGYNPTARLWCCRVPALDVPLHPRRDDAEAALRALRRVFRTFAFADARKVRDPETGVDVVDLNEPVGRDESAALNALLTAACRASLYLAPGLAVTAPEMSGAGTGKGLLVRAICAVAFGIRPHAVTAGHNADEMDKRIVAEAIKASPAIFLDNVNGVVLRSDTLASLMSERPAAVRVLGETRTVELNSAAWIAVTGNGLLISEDLARRFLICELDAGMEDPEQRPFPPGFLDGVEAARSELLGAALTIWRWGRTDRGGVTRGRPLGGFETWAEWVRDPLLTLGCRDPVERIEVTKARDPRRQGIAEIFERWWHCHWDQTVTAATLSADVRDLIDPHKRGRQYVAARLARLVDTRGAGFVLTRQDSGKWNAATYRLISTEGRKVPEAPQEPPRGDDSFDRLPPPAGYDGPDDPP